MAGGCRQLIAYVRRGCSGASQGGIHELTITWIPQSAVLDRRAFRISEKSPTHPVQNPGFHGEFWVREARKLNYINSLWSGRWESNPSPKLGKLLFSEKEKQMMGNGRMDEAS